MIFGFLFYGCMVVWRNRFIGFRRMTSQAGRGLQRFDCCRCQPTITIVGPARIVQADASQCLEMLNLHGMARLTHAIKWAHFSTGLNK